MQAKLLFAKWTQIAGLLLIGGALAWTIKLSVIIATNGRIIDTGAAALFMKIGLLLLLTGTTGVGSRISQNRNALVRTIATILSPVVVFGSLVMIGSFVTPLFENSSVWYAQQEAPIGIAVIAFFILGFILYKSHKPVTQ